MKILLKKGLLADVHSIFARNINLSNLHLTIKIVRYIELSLNFAGSF